MGSVKLGARYAVDEYLKINPSQRVVVITDRKSARLSKAIINAAEKRTPETHVFVMEDYGTKKREFPREIMSLFEDPEKKVVSFYLSNISYDDRFTLLRMGDPVADLLDKENLSHIKHASMGGISKKIMQQGVCVPKELLMKYSSLIYRRIKDAKEIIIESPGGTELEIILDPKKIGWCKEDHLDYGIWENLPLGEVYTSPIDCNGKIVIDCMVGGGFEADYGFGFLRRYPITVKIKKGEVTEVTCRRSTHLISSWGDELFNSDNVANYVGEIGFGTNFGLDRLIGNILQDEKFPGVHIGIGSSMPDCGEKWRSDMHTDIMMLNPYVWVDGNPLMEDGHYILRNGNGNGNGRK
ncbi:aminopeptidase [Candidatus Woesearchaeota archaeon]|nr:aminopeptidase [Candidatus Woesearchaeota archaeon]